MTNHLASFASWRVLCHLNFPIHLASFDSWRVLCHLKMAMNLANFGGWRISFLSKLAMHLASLGSWRIFGTQVFQALSEFRQLASYGSDFWQLASFGSWRVAQLRVMWQLARFDTWRVLAHLRIMFTWHDFFLARFQVGEISTWQKKKLALLPTSPDCQLRRSQKVLEKLCNIIWMMRGVSQKFRK